jgi:ABC-type nitrate/sulfonate/bicarbonate transport system substrate-binding protein
MFNKKFFIITIILILVLAACGVPNQNNNSENEEPSSAQSPLVPIDVMLDWVPNTNHTGIFVARDKGWYEAAGLAVNIIQAGESPVEQVVASGSADFGISYQEAVTLARTEGAPIVSVAAVIQHNTSGFASRADRNITRPKDFEGKTYGGWGSPVESAMLDLLMSCDGGDVSKVNVLDTGFADFFAITQKEVDFAWIFYGWDGVNAELKDIPVNVIMLNEWQECVPDYYTPVMITSEKTIAEKPEIVKAFISATAEGYEFAIENPDEAADILLQAAPESDPELVTASQQWLADQYQADAEQWGLQDETVWQRYADWLYQQDLISKPLDAEAAFSNEFLSED